jgi:hypothetical protein
MCVRLGPIHREFIMPIFTARSHRWPRQLALVSLAGLCLASAQAQDNVIGYIKTVEANASIVTAGQAEPAKPGMPLLMGQVLKTGKPGSMGVTFKDNTSMSIGPETELVVNEYLYAPGKGDLKLGASLTRGSLYYISGVIAKLKPESVSIKTPTGLIGVRGTQFVAKVDPEDKE